MLLVQLDCSGTLLYFWFEFHQGRWKSCWVQLSGKFYKQKSQIKNFKLWINFLRFICICWEESAPAWHKNLFLDSNVWVQFFCAKKATHRKIYLHLYILLISSTSFLDKCFLCPILSWFFFFLVLIVNLLASSVLFGCRL